MRRSRESSKSGLFLIELIFAVLFFAVTSGTCVRLFVQAHMIARESKNLSMAVTISRSAAESIKALGADPAQMLAELPGGIMAGEDHIVMYYDKDWRETDASSPAYRMDIYINSGASPVQADIDVREWESAESIYNITVARYISGH